MPLLRLSDCASLSGWDPPGTAATIARQWFDRFADTSPSLYEANTLEEEVEVVAALPLTHKAPKRRPYHILRIYPDDLASAGIAPSNANPGTTGVVAVDFRHWEIPANAEQLVHLIDHILVRLAAGEDRLRWIGVLQQEPQWRRFLEVPANEVLPEAKRRCLCLMKKHPYQFTANQKQLVEEFIDHSPAIPRGRIEARAWQKYQNRLLNQFPGNSELDWLEAEAELRAVYLQMITGFTAPPEELLHESG